MKKLGKYFLCSVALLVVSVSSVSHAQDDAPFPYNLGEESNPTSDVGDIFKSENIDREDSSFQGIVDDYDLGDNVEDEDSGVQYVIRLINIALGLVSFIALVYLIISFYRLFFTPYESGVSNLRKVITGLIIAILIIGLSWFIVSYIFEARGLLRSGL